MHLAVIPGGKELVNHQGEHLYTQFYTLKDMVWVLRITMASIYSLSTSIISINYICNLLVEALTC